MRYCLEIQKKACQNEFSKRSICAGADRLWSGLEQLFICDRLDVLLPSGEGDDGGGTPARETKALAAMLSRLLFESAERAAPAAVALLACCRTKSALVPRMCASGRFDRAVELALPDAASRTEQLTSLRATPPTSQISRR